MEEGLDKALEILTGLFEEALEKCDKAKAEYEQYKTTSRYKAGVAEYEWSMAIGEMEAISEAKRRILDERFNERKAV